MATAVAMPTARNPLRAVKAAITAGVGRLLRPHRAALSNLADMPFSVAGLASIDVGVFQASTVAGWIITGISLMFLEFLIADEV